MFVITLIGFKLVKPLIINIVIIAILLLLIKLKKIKTVLFIS